MAAVARLHAAGLRLAVRGDTLLVEPRSALNDELRQFIRQNKPAILRELVTLERRRQQVERELAEHSEKRVAADAPLRPEPGAPVSVVIACRTPAGIVSGELLVQRERFDAALFFRTLEAATGRPQ
jgi:hypothetical protein